VLPLLVPRGSAERLAERTRDAAADIHEAMVRVS